jgi:Ca-activated chloride channel family protein
MNLFADPGMFFWLWVPAAATVAFLLRRRAQKKLSARLGRPETVERMLPPGLARRRDWAALCTVCGLTLWVIALAGPLLGARLVEFKQRGIDVFIAVDCSSSMLAEDLKPNRMAHAKLLLAQLIDRLANDRLGIIAFAGQAFVECPLTLDAGAARQILDSIDVGTVPIPGTVIGEAIRTAIKSGKSVEGGTRVLVLLTDGEDHHSDPIGAGKEAAKAGIKVFAIGIGTDQGEPVPAFDEQGNRSGYKRDKKGDVILSRMDEKTLIQITQDAGGQYFRATPSGDEVDQIATALEGLKQGDQKTRLFNRFENRYQWPLALGLLFLIAALAIPEQGWGDAS